MMYGSVQTIFAMVSYRTISLDQLLFYSAHTRAPPGVNSGCQVSPQLYADDGQLCNPNWFH